ncbi:MAG TPA: carboxypeptidase regulatory-like domain-containing protein [Acidobacteriota bacterium]|nr:carboxypeptidase regulatory-like domain-containing protein [Acidobacteriota bacterium]
MKQPLVWGLVLCVLLLVGGTWVAAQSAGSASLRGTVKDPTGAVVPGADVTIINENTKDERHTITDESGGFFFGALRPGPHTLRVELPGFKTYEETGLVLRPAEARGVSVTLELGEMTETITITSVAEFIKTETPAKEDTITAQQIDNLSIIGRSALELLRVLPGVVAPTSEQLQSVSFGGGSNQNSAYNVNGLRGEFNIVTFDGARMQDIGSNNGTILTANPEMVQEVTVQTSNYSAEHGTSGVQISAISKSGTSEFHGTVYDYIRHYKLAANDRSRNLIGSPRPESKFQYPGFNVGGPVLFPGTNFNRNRDKLFFFVGFEVQLQDVDSGSVLGVVPTLKQRQGDYSELLEGKGLNFGQPQTVLIPQGYPGAGEAAPNNDLSPYIHPWGKVFTDLYPAPNLDPATTDYRYNYAYGALAPTDRTQLLMRFDYNFSENTKLYVRLGRETEEVEMNRGIWWDSSRFELPSHVQGDNLGRSLSANLVQVLNPTTTNELVVSASKLELDNDYKEPESLLLSTLGMPEYRGLFDPSQIRNQYVPVAYFSWGQGLGEFWEPGGLPMFAHNDSISVIDNFNKVVGAHALKFGGFIEQANKKQNFNGDDEGAFELGSTWTPGNTGNDYGDLLVGRIAAYGQTTSTPVGHFRLWNYEWYVQDNWKVRPGLTLELGVRFAYWPNNYERDGLELVFVPADYLPGEGPFPGGDVTRPNGVRFAKYDEIPKGISEDPSLLVMPRVGFAWDIRGDAGFVLRAGIGVFYNRPQGNTQYWVLQTPPNQYNASIDTWSGQSLGGGEGLTYNTISEVDPFSRLGSVTMRSQTLDAIDVPQVTNASLSLASRLPFDQVLEVAYVGTFGRHLSAQRNINAILPGTFLSGTVGNADLSDPIQRVALNDQARAQFLPFGAYGNIMNTEYSTNSNYHSLQATLRRQAGQRLQYYATYTFSKVLGTQPGGDYTEIDPLDNKGRNYGVLSYDRTHIFNLSYTYQVPSLAKGGFRNGFTKAVFDGWQWSGITTFASGTPVTSLSFSGPLGSAGVERAFFGTDSYRTGVAPLYLCDPRTGNSGVGEAVIDLGCLGIPAFGETGPTQPPYYMRLVKGRWNFDMTFFKDFDFGEDRRLQFRAGLFNIFNQAYPLNTGEDIRLTLNTVCNVEVDGVPDGVGGLSDGVCDPTQGFSYDDLTQAEFGQIVSKRGHRIIELALKFYF